MRTLEGDSVSLRKAANDMSRQMTKQTVSVSKRKGAHVSDSKGYRPNKAEKGRPNRLQRDLQEDQLINRKRITAPTAVKLNSRLDNYFRALQDPWTLQGIRCPVNYNPVPSFLITTAHTTRTVPTLTVNPGTTTQLTLFPGHSHNIDTDAMDGVSYHAGLTRINGINYPCGPLILAVNPTIGAETSGLAAGVDVTNLDTAVSTSMNFDVQLPYIASNGNGGHSRWKLVSMGITIENTTPIQTRGGQIQHVMPAAAIQATGNILADYASQPTFRITTEANEGAVKLAWIPRADDLAFWHVDTSSVTGGIVNAGVVVWITAPTGAAFTQTYSYQVVCNWELSGHSLAAVSAPTIHQPADKNVVEPVISALQFTKSHATDVVNIAKAVASNAPAIASHTSKAMSYLSDIFG